MFDEITVKAELPLPQEVKHLNIDWKTHKFQTKDLDNCLSEYVITEEGKLLERITEREYVPYSKEEKKSKDRKPWDLWKDVIDKGIKEEELSYHGTLMFYAYEDFDETHDFWIDFKAYFIYGKLDKIELVEYKKEPSRKISNKQFEEEHKQKQRHPWNVFKRKAARFGWNRFWKAILSLCRHSSDAINSLQTFIWRYML